MLKHHANAKRAGGAGAFHRNRRTTPDKPPRIRAQQAIDNLDQGGFARAVFAKQRMDFPGRHGQVHGVIGKQGAEALGDALSGKKRGGCLHDRRVTFFVFPVARVVRHQPAENQPGRAKAASSARNSGMP